MTRPEAREVFNSLVCRYPSMRITDATAAAYIDEIETFPALAAQHAALQWAREQPRFPAIAALRHAILAAAHEHRHAGDAAASPRLVLIGQWQWDWNCPWFAADVREDAREHLSHMVPSVTQDEWDTAWRIAGEKHLKYLAQCRKAGAPEPRPAPPLTEKYPPLKSYAGRFPSPGEDAYLVPRAEGAQRMQAILYGLLRQRGAVPVPREPGAEG